MAAPHAARRAAILGVALALAGCAVGPDYHRPASWTPAQWASPMPVASTDDARVKSVPVADVPDAAWWDIFGDPELSRLERRVAMDNLSVQVATARLAQSRAQLMIAGAERYPGLSASGSYSRAQYSTKELQYALGQVGKSVGGSSSDTLKAASSEASIPLLNMWKDSIDAQWEVDLWGRVRRQYESAQADMDASAEQRRSVLIAQLAEVARDYMALRGAQEQLRIARDNSRVAAGLLKLSRQRNQAGLVSELDVQSAQSQFENIDAQIAQISQEVASDMNALSLLMGQPPHALEAELATSVAIPAAPPRVPVGVPSELARRRPDIRQAEDQLHAATAQVGMAVADFYPKVTIDASFGFQSLSFRDLGFWNARAWNVGPSITLPIFQGGRLRGTLELRKDAQKEAAISYRQTVLQAWHDVDNALTAYRDEQIRHDGLEREVGSDRRSLDLAQDQYRHGLATYLTVLDAQRRLLQSEQGLATSTTAISSNLVQLYNALGGGWEQTFSDSRIASAATP